MAKKVLIVHGWEGYPEEGWFPWLKKELEKHNCIVSVPGMPDAANPRMMPWVSRLKAAVGQPSKDVFLVGHSLGCITILRYLEGLQPGEKIGGAVLVAGFSDNLGFREINSFFERPINWGKILEHCGNFVAIHSDNDPYVPARHGRMFQRVLKARLVMEKGQKHFSGSEGKRELPSVLEALLSM